MTDKLWMDQFNMLMFSFNPEFICLLNSLTFSVSIPRKCSKMFNSSIKEQKRLFPGHVVHVTTEKHQNINRICYYYYFHSKSICDIVFNSSTLIEWLTLFYLLSKDNCKHSAFYHRLFTISHPRIEHTMYIWLDLSKCL